MEKNAVNRILSESDKLINSKGYDLHKEYERIIELAQFESKATIYDFACGSGRGASILLGNGFQVKAFDFNETQFIKAKQRLTNEQLKRIEFIKMDLENIEYEDNSIDNIVCLNTIHEVENPIRIINEIFRVYSGKGKLVVCDFNKVGFDLMDIVHEIIYNDNHNLGKMNQNQFEEFLTNKKISYKAFETELNWVKIIG